TATKRALFDLMGVRFLLLEDGKEAAVDPSLVLVRREAGVSLYENPQAKARAFVVSEVMVVSSPDEALARTAAADLDHVAFVEDPGPAGLPSGVPPGGAGQADIVRYAPDAVTIRARTEGGGLLVLSDRYDPGWQATLDGVPTTVHRTDYLFRGVILPPGEHV